MKNKINRVVAVFIIVSILFGMSNTIFAAVMTDTELDKAIETFKNNLQKEAAESGDTNNATVDIKRENNKIIVDSNGEISEFMYDFSSECKFYVDMEYTKTMSFEEAQTKTDDSSMPMLGFMIIASNKGCKSMDSLAYVFFTLLSEMENGVEIKNEGSTMNGLEYAKKLYEDSTPLDKELFKTNIEKISETSDKIVLRSNFIVKENGDFTKINGAWDNIFPGNGNTNDNTNGSTNGNVNQNNNTNTNKNNANQKELPKAGIDIEQLEILKITSAILMIAIILVGGSLLAKKSK